MTCNNDNYSGPERRTHAKLSDELIEAIAEKAAEKAIERLTGDVYKAVGKSVIQKFTWLVGVIAVGVYIYLRKIGVIT